MQLKGTQPASSILLELALRNLLQPKSCARIKCRVVGRRSKLSYRQISDEQADGLAGQGSLHLNGCIVLKVITNTATG